MARTAVVLFNLGGPDTPEAVRPFLFNLFNDPAIIGLPWPLRWILAQVLAARRAPLAREIYARIGGSSPLLALTHEQAKALEERLVESAMSDVKVFVVMRYWHPMSDETALLVKDYDPDAVVLLPLYPQFSTTTTGSSLRDWKRAARAAGITAPARAVCCYSVQGDFIAAQAILVSAALDNAGSEGARRVLFSAHGLPKRIVEKGDPYAWQVARTARAVVDAMDRPGLDWTVCYQSRVGPLEWIGPSVETELERAAADGVAVIVVPIAFVSEHSETLVELDMEYRDMARRLGVPAYRRVAALGTEKSFIDGLAALVRHARESGRALISEDGPRLCPGGFARCPNRVVD